MGGPRKAVVDNHGFRYYDPEIGRYLTRDPASYVDGLNPYLYVGNNPINFIDPEGLEEKKSGIKDAISSLWTYLKVLNAQLQGTTYLGTQKEQDQVNGVSRELSKYAPQTPQEKFEAATDLKGYLARKAREEATRVAAETAARAAAAAMGQPLDPVKQEIIKQGAEAIVDAALDGLTDPENPEPEQTRDGRTFKRVTGIGVRLE